MVVFLLTTPSVKAARAVTSLMVEQGTNPVLSASLWLTILRMRPLVGSTTTTLPAKVRGAAMPASGSKVKATKGIEKKLFMQAALYCDIHYNGSQGMENLVILSRTGRNPSVRDGNPDSEAEPSRNFWNLRFSDDSDLPNCLGTESALIGTRQLACGAHTSALGVFKNGSIIRP